MARVLPALLKIPESNNYSHSVDSLYLHGFSGSGRGSGGGACAPTSG